MQTDNKRFFLPAEFSDGWADEKNNDWRKVDSLLSEISQDGELMTPDEITTGDIEVSSEDSPGTSRLATFSIEKTSGGMAIGSDVDITTSNNYNAVGDDISLTRNDGSGNLVGNNVSITINNVTDTDAYGYYSEIQQNSSGNGIGFYTDSTRSEFTPQSVLADDENSVWKNGIELRGEYINSIIDADSFGVDSDGNIHQGSTTRHDNPGKITDSFEITRNDTQESTHLWSKEVNDTPLSQLIVDADGDSFRNQRVYRDTGIETSRVGVDSNYTAPESVEIVGVDTSDGEVTITLPDASDGHRKTIKDEGGNASANSISIEATGSIDGKDSISINGNYSSLTVYTDGTDWYIW